MDNAMHGRIVETIKRRGMTIYSLFLEMASNIANSSKQPISWDHVLKAHDSLWVLSNRTGVAK